MGQFVPVQEVAARIRAIDDPVLRGKVAKALHLLRRTLELYRCAPPASLARSRVEGAAAGGGGQQHQQLLPPSTMLPAGWPCVLGSATGAATGAASTEQPPQPTPIAGPRSARAGRRTSP